MTNIWPIMPDLVLADTGPLYALADPSDQYHRQAASEMRALAEQHADIVVAYPTLAEAYTLILRRLGSAYARSWIDEITEGSMLINPDAGDYIGGCAILTRFADQPLTLFDAVAAALSVRIHARVWTYDRHFDFMRVKRWKALVQ